MLPSVLVLLRVVVVVCVLAPRAVAGEAPARDLTNAGRYGTKGDGVADDAPAIQAALDNEGRVLLPPGTYRLGSRLVVRRSGGGLVGAGAGSTVLKPDATVTAGTLTVLSPSNQTLTDIEIANFTMDGSADPAKVQGIGVYNCKRVRVHGLSPVRMAGMVHLEGVENFAITDIAASELIEFISLNTVKKGVISNIRVDGADEGVDFYNAEDVEVTGVVISARDPLVIRPLPYSAGVDLSSSRRITIANSTFSGHYTGIHIKQEGGGPNGPPVEDVMITGCQIRDYVTTGINFSLAEGRGCRIQNCNVRTTRKDATGIYAYLPKGFRLDELVIADCTIDSTLHGIQLSRYDGVEIRQCRIRSSDSHALYLRDCADPVVTGCHIRSRVKAAVLMTSVDGPAVEACNIAGEAGIWISNCRRPVLRRNTIPSAAGRAISIEWTDESGLDAAKRVAGFVVDDNVIRNWSSASMGNPAIFVSFTGISGAPYNQGSVSGNRLLLDSGAMPHSQSGISFSRGDLAAIDWVKVENNLIYGPYAGVLGVEALGPNSVRGGNVFKQNLP